MKIIKWKIGDTTPSIEGQLAVAIGNFDGIHKGHVKLLNECKLQANKSNLAFGVVTFDPHPKDFFNPKNPSFKLLDAEEKEKLLSKIGVEHLIIIEFNEQLKNCSGEEFLSQINDKNVDFIIKPTIRFKGEIGEQRTMFFKDPSGNAIEIKAFKDMSNLFSS